MRVERLEQRLAGPARPNIHPSFSIIGKGSSQEERGIEPVNEKTASAHSGFRVPNESIRIPLYVMNCTPGRLVTNQLSLDFVQIVWHPYCSYGSVGPLGMIASEQEPKTRGTAELVFTCGLRMGLPLPKGPTKIEMDLGKKGGVSALFPFVLENLRLKRQRLDRRSRLI